jgi:hypothetical protein
MVVKIKFNTGTLHQDREECDTESLLGRLKVSQPPVIQLAAVTLLDNQCQSRGVRQHAGRRGDGNRVSACRRAGWRRRRRGGRGTAASAAADRLQHQEKNHPGQWKCSSKALARCPRKPPQKRMQQDREQKHRQESWPENEAHPAAASSAADANR